MKTPRGVFYFNESEMTGKYGYQISFAANLFVFLEFLLSKL